MSEKLSPVMKRYNNYTYGVHCPGCDLVHLIYTDHPDNVGYPKWEWDGDVNKPTFSPSLLVTYNWGEERREVRCHSFIRNGQWVFLNDCTHTLAGKTIPFVEFPEDD